jgi:hypothetical protein
MNPCTAPGSASRRMEEGFEDAEIKLLNLLAKHIPVVAVITKSRADNGFRSEVQRLLGKSQQCHSSPGNPGTAG